MSSWPKWEKRRQSGLVLLAAVASGAIAFGPQNERRMFLLPVVPSAFAAMPAPEGTLLRSPILGYLDPCAPGNAFVRVATGERCARPARRPAARQPVADEPQEPSAFFAMPDDPLGIDNNPLVQFLGIDPIPTDLPNIGGNPFGRPFNFMPGVPPMLVLGVPEPASWAMMIAGFALVGASMRRARKVRVAYA